MTPDWILVLCGFALGVSAMSMIDAAFGLPFYRRNRRLLTEIESTLDAVDDEIARFQDAGVVFPPRRPTP